MRDVESRIVYWMLAEAVPERDGSASLDWLSESEMRRMEALRFPKRRVEWLNGRWTAKNLLIRNLPSLSDCLPSEILIENEPEGAPCVCVSGQELVLSLSISHRDRLAFCALSEGSALAIGADVEYIESRAQAFVDDFFTDRERRLIEEKPVVERDRLVTLIWSAKEAALKALRKGLRLDTRSVEIDAILETGDSGGTFSVRSAQTADRAWRGWWQIHGNYMLTLALLGKPESVIRARLAPAWGKFPEFKKCPDFFLREDVITTDQISGFSGR